jgi:hypothetical protein
VAAVVTGSTADVFQQLLGIADAPALIENDEDVARAAGCGRTAIDCRPGDKPAVWMDGPECRVLVRPRRTRAEGETFAEFVAPSGEAFPCREVPGGGLELPFSLTEAYESYVTERWASADGGRGLSAGQLDAYYRIKRAIPRRVQLALRRWLIRWQGSPEFPRALRRQRRATGALLRRVCTTRDRKAERAVQVVLAGRRARGGDIDA